jgi:hydrogenase maturation protein HypF
VALSGGVFQNNRLLTGLGAVLEKSGFDLLTHRLVPANDGGISLGQAVVAAAKMDGLKRKDLDGVVGRCDITDTASSL